MLASAGRIALQLFLRAGATIPKAASRERGACSLSGRIVRGQDTPAFSPSATPAMRAVLIALWLSLFFSRALALCHPPLAGLLEAEDLWTAIHSGGGRTGCREGCGRDVCDEARRQAVGSHGPPKHALRAGTAIVRYQTHARCSGSRIGLPRRNAGPRHHPARNSTASREPSRRTDACRCRCAIAAAGALNSRPAPRARGGVHSVHVPCAAAGRPNASAS